MPTTFSRMEYFTPRSNSTIQHVTLRLYTVITGLSACISNTTKTYNALSSHRAYMHPQADKTINDRDYTYVKQTVAKVIGN